MIKAILFDFGGVILDLEKKQTIQIPQALSLLFGITHDEAIHLWSEEREKLLIGKETPRKFIDRVKKKLSCAKETETLLKEWEEMAQKEPDLINWELISFIGQLKGKYKVYVLSDTINLAQNDKLSKNIYAKFDDCFLSFKEGYKKPGREAFLNVLKKIKLKPKECLFIDDTESNIVAAKTLGINVIKYLNLEQFKKELMNFII